MEKEATDEMEVAEKKAQKRETQEKNQKSQKQIIFSSIIIFIKKSMINSNMSIKYDFGNPEKLAEFVVGENILESMAEKKRKNIIERVASVMKNYRGSELLVCEILSSSAEQGELERYLEDLEIHQCLKKLKIYRQRPILYSSPLRRLIVYEM